MKSRAAILAVLAAQILLFGWLWVGVLRDSRHTDYVAFYAAGRLARTEGFDQSFDAAKQYKIQAPLSSRVRAAGQPATFAHPPLLLPLLAAVAVDSYQTSAALWGAFLLLVLAGCGVLMYRALRRADWPAIDAALGAALCAVIHPAAVGVMAGQETSVVMLAGLLALTASDDKRAGLGLSLAVVKPQLALGLAASLVRSRPRAFLWFCVGAAALALLSLALIGVNGARDLINLTILSGRNSSPFTLQGQMFNLAGLLIRMGQPHAQQIAWAAFVGWLCLAPLVSRRIGFPVAVIMSIFLSPYLHGYDLGLLVVPVIALMQKLKPSAGLLVPASLSIVSVLGYQTNTRHAVSYLIMLTLAFALITTPRSLYRTC